MKLHYMTVPWGIVSFSGLKTLFFTHLQPCLHQILQAQLQLSQLHLWNSFQINHRFCLWHHPLTGTPQNNMIIFSCFVNQWKVGSPFRIFQQRCQRIPWWNPTPLDWSTCSFSWATLATGSLTVGSQLPQLMRLWRKKGRLQPSWTTCHLWWTMQYHNTAEPTNWKMFESDLESHQMNSLTISELLLIDATSQQKRNKMSSTDSPEP